jgi:hypothetical protein
MVWWRVLKTLDQRKQAKLQWLQNTSQTNGSNLNNIRCGTGRNNKKEYLKEEIDDLDTNTKNRSIRDI